MIDTDKYEGHTEGPWHYHFFDGVDEKYHSATWGGVFGIQLPVGHSADAKLIADAPLLLAEVERLREIQSERHKRIAELGSILDSHGICDECGKYWNDHADMFHRGFCEDMGDEEE